MIKNLFTSAGGISGVIAGLVWLDGIVAPALPPVWQNLIVAIFGLIALYKHAVVVSAARSANVSGV